MGKCQKVLVNGELYEIEVLERTRELVRFSLDGRNYDVRFEFSVPSSSSDLSQATSSSKVKSNSRKLIGGQKSSAGVESLSGGERSNGDIIAPIPGLIIEILVNVGDIVKVGDLVAKLEAMKMQNNIYASTSGRVTEIFVTVGDEVSDRTLLLHISSE